MTYLRVLGLVGWGSLGWAVPVFAHGVLLEHQPISGIEIQARYDNGDPMGAAQVNVYAPDNPREPWLTGTTDDDGRFVFTPDPSRPGNWEVMVRQAGHGDIVAIPVAGDETVMENSAAADPPEGDGGSGQTSSGQTSSGQTSVAGVPLWVSMAAVVWGFVGTALFFARGKR